MKLSHMTAFAVMSFLIAASACKPVARQARPESAGSYGQSSASQSAANTVAHELIGDWTIIDVKGRQVTVSDSSDAPHMGFSTNRDNASLVDFYAYNGCNFINGVVAVQGNKFVKQGDFAATMKMCPDAQYEIAISTALEQMKSLRIDKINNESFLYLLDGAGHTLMTMRKHNLNFLEGAWAVTEIDGNKLPKDVDIRNVIDLHTNTIHGNAGCNTLNGLVTINMAVENGIGFTELRTTRMTCPDIAYESAYLQALGNVATATGNASEAQLRNASGKVIIVMKRLSKDDLMANRR